MPIANMYPYDKNVRDEVVVLCCECALSRSGVGMQTGQVVDRFTRFETLDNLDLVVMHFVYNPNIDFTNYVTPMENNPLILLPTPERAIVESIIYLDYCDEGELILAIQMYIDWKKNIDLLYEVAEFFKLKKETLDYWIKEARDETWGGN